MSHRTISIMIVITPLRMDPLIAQPSRAPERSPVDDAKVRAFLDVQKGSCRDMNVPESDGKLLYDLIVQNRYKDILEIGTSTGHSTIWLAWACSKNGGKVTTIEIDEGRHRQALPISNEQGSRIMLMPT